MALTSDILTTRYGTGGAEEPLNYGLTAATTVYRGSVALLAAGTGYLKNSATPAATDLVVGLIANAGAGTADTGPGILGGATDGAVTVEIATGSFLLASGTGSDALGVTTNMKTVYLINESTVGATNGGSTRPVAGVQLSCNTSDASIPVGFVAVKLGTATSPVGGP